MAVKPWYGVSYRPHDAYRALLYEADFSYQRPEVAQFEEALEKKSSISDKRIPKARS